MVQDYVLQPQGQTPSPNTQDPSSSTTEVPASHHETPSEAAQTGQGSAVKERPTLPAPGLAGPDAFLGVNHPVPHLKFNLDHSKRRTGAPSPVEGSKITTLLSTVDAIPDAVPDAVPDSGPQMGMFHVFFLPPILVEDVEPPVFQGLAFEESLCEKLTKSLRLDPFFLTTEAWKSNGFLISQQHQKEPDGETKDNATRSYATRFLIKFLETPEISQEYSWLYLSFSILWVKRNGQVSCILVCYDDSLKIKAKIEEWLTDYPTDNIMQNPLAIHDALLRAIIFNYDKALWLFRKPVRDIEKHRHKFVKSISGSEDGQPGDSKEAVGDLIEMHELSRHAIHMSETLRVAQKTVKAMLQVAESHGNNGSIPDGMIDNTLAGLQFSNLFLANLKLRSDAFVDRIKNEIRLAYNIISVTQLQESRQEGKDLTSIVTMLSLVFLPATFVAGFWGMNFIALEGRNIIISDQIWWFAVSAVTAVVLCVSIWMGPHYFHMKYSLRGVISFLRGHLQPPVRAILFLAGKIRDKGQNATGTEPTPASAV